MKKTIYIIVVSLILFAIGYIAGKHETPANGKEIEYAFFEKNQKDTLSEWNTLQMAIAMTESKFNPDAVGTSMDYGIYQITPIYVKEINRLLGEQVYTHDQAFNIEKSVEMFNVMQSFKNPEQDIDKAIYFHNKAPWYKKKVMMNYEIVKRYETLRSILCEQI